ncbi:hypothetical protein EWM64_g6273 [Hericium alpestre]|uniref:Uncharacterized protein n=1 Tax=Hericium alpestre TaxID=135208 RepID=A0A4Y9ZV45_9AGAM|nr:hypothetical protein EWM64_g6273 [Hericium alpestre]
MVRKKAKRSMVPWSQWKGCVVWIGTGPSPYAQNFQHFAPPQHTAGMRIVTARDSGHVWDDRRMPWSLCAMDFNSWRVARALTEGLNAGESVEHSSSISASEGLFEDDIVIEYPYLKKTAEITPPAHAAQYYKMVAMIAEDGVFIADKASCTTIHCCIY